ncbi:MAG: hypothetical protein J5651_04730 [Salinivirgaceae bacterium]|nr:hypothetical protein [Salinivirgaceae bacterium]MBO7594037.1 hypothetical protein [Salinivirgaceae bacterium]
MNSTLSKIIGIFSAILLAVSAVSGIVTFVTGEYIDWLLIWTYILAGGAFLVIIVMSLIGMLNSKKSALTLLGVLALAAVIVFGAHSIASDVLPTFHGVEEYNLTISLSKWVDTALYVTYLLFGAAILGLAVTAVRSAAE